MSQERMFYRRSPKLEGPLVPMRHSSALILILKIFHSEKHCKFRSCIEMGPSQLIRMPCIGEQYQNARILAAPESVLGNLKSPDQLSLHTCVKMHASQKWTWEEVMSSLLMGEHFWFPWVIFHFSSGLPIAMMWLLGVFIGSVKPIKQSGWKHLLTRRGAFVTWWKPVGPNWQMDQPDDDSRPKVYH